MAKLARLMQSCPPQYIDPELLADSGEGVSGALPVAGMQRLRDLLSRTTGSVRFSLQFSRDARRRIRVCGHFSTTLGMCCQRCLEVMDVGIAGDIAVTLVADEAEAKRLPREEEPMVVSTKLVDLALFLEDELLLAVPLAPNHDNAKCHARLTGDDAPVRERQQPFSALADLQLKNSNK